VSGRDINLVKGAGGTVQESEHSARKGRRGFFLVVVRLENRVMIGSWKSMVGFFSFFSPVFNQSQGQGWERGGRGVAGQPGMRGERGCIRGIFTSQLGW